MKRVLHVIDHLGLGGAQSLLLDLLPLMDPAQFQCEVAAMHGCGVFMDALEARGIPTHSLASSPWSLAYIAAFIRLQHPFDILHFHLSGANWIAKPLAGIVGSQPRIIHDHASADLRFRGVGSMILDAFMHRFTSHAVAISEEVKEFLVQKEALSPGDITVITNGVNTELFRPFTLEEKKEARRFFNLPEEMFVIGTVGRLVHEKNQELFLKAAAEALKQGLQALFVLAGTGPEEGALKALVEQLGIVDSVRFLGSVEERILLYRSFDLFALTSRYEGLPMVLLEAMASGVPVASTDLKGIRQALEGGSYGRLIPSEDENRWVSYFKNISEREGEELALKARTHVCANFSAQQAAYKLGELYKRLT